MTATLLAANVLALTAQSTVIIGSALLLLTVVRLTAPGVRYLLLRMLLGLCLLLPLVAPRTVRDAGDDLQAVGPSGVRSGFSLPWRHRDAAGSERRTVPVPAAEGNAMAPWAPWFLFTLVTGTSVRLAWMAAGLLRLRALRHAGEPAPPSAEYDELQARLGTRAHVRLVPDLGQPVTFGLRTPVVLLPTVMRSLPAGIQRAVLAHELWHVRRHDWSWVLVEELVRAAFWFHPAMWALVSRIQAAREEAVDELAILATGSRRSYLDALITFADRPSSFAAAAFARRRHLVHRMLMISKESVMSSTRVVACSAALVAVVAGTSWYSLSAFPLTTTAQTPRDRPAPPPPPPPSVDFHQREAAALENVKERPGALSYHILATVYYERAFREPSLTPDEKNKLIADGLAASDDALAYDANYFEAVVYKNLLLRLQAQLETNPADRARLIAEADRLRARAMELKPPPTVPKPQRSADMPPPPPPPPPPPGDQSSAAAAVVDGEFPIRVGGNVAPPTKIRDVRPVYPAAALESRVSGVVILEATVDREGKVRNARVLRSVPLLDAAAIEAVREWRFAPTLLNGVAVPVIMTLTVNFTLD